MIAGLVMLGAMAAPLPPVLPWRGASERLVAARGSTWETPVEASGFAETPSLEATQAWLERLAAKSPLLRVERFGTSAQGRPLLLVRAGAGRPGPARPVVLMVAGIHAGEIDGKDAGLMLLRDIAAGGRADLLAGVDLLFVPVFNADGHARHGPFSRPNQRGPENQGWRTTAQNLNLNRDWLKADSPEMRAMLELIGRERPQLMLDLHVTDGSDYRYDITIGWNGAATGYAQSPAIGAWLDRSYGPAMRAALERAGHVPGPLVFAVDDADPRKGNSDAYFTGRFSNGYTDLARFGGVLVENHSLKPYRQRVLGTRVLMEATLRHVAADGGALNAAIAADRARPAAELVTAWKDLPEPIRREAWKGVEYGRYRSEALGTEVIRYTGRPADWVMPVFGQAPERRVRLPRAWIVPPEMTGLIARLRLHGVAAEPLREAARLRVTMLRLPEAAPAMRVDEGRVPLRVGVPVAEVREEVFPQGSLRVRADQPLGLLAASLIEPESPESLLAWGEGVGVLQRTEYIERYAVAPMADAMLREPGVKAAFEAALAADAGLAADPQRRAEWFYARSPYADARWRLYPVGREE